MQKRTAQFNSKRKQKQNKKRLNSSRAKDLLKTQRKIQNERSQKSNLSTLKAPQFLAHDRTRYSTTSHLIYK